MLWQRIVLFCFSSQFEEFATNAAIQCTETYEYGLSLANPNLVLHEFLVYKFIYILRLIDCGLLEEVILLVILVKLS